MKNITTLFLSFLIMGSAFAQINVNLKINHKLGAATFFENWPTSNNLGNGFDVNRLEYYISEILLVHDGGTETMVPDTWLLVDATTPLEVALGSYMITNLEAIKFGIGVNSDANHLDPSLYDMTHPLAPKSPSMHWGWAAGYRFVAMEGKSGTSLAQTYQIHALGDVNYFMATINTEGTMEAGELMIALDADYTMAMKDIDLSSGLINHGETAEARDLLANFAEFVFTEASNSVSIDHEIQQQHDMVLAPNPTISFTTIQVKGDQLNDLTVGVSDLTGKVISNKELPLSGALELKVETPGIYFISLRKEGVILQTEKLVVTQ